MSLNLLSFGYIPSGTFWNDLVGKFRGAENLFKRLQARTILQVVTPRLGERILDFGCGGGHFAYELARRGARVIGADIVPLPNSIQIGKGSLDFMIVPTRPPLPIERGYFDKIFISEVITVLPDPLAVCKELFDLSAPHGKIILVNTLGRNQIEKAFEANSVLVRLFKKWFKNCPANYEEFCLRFMEADRVSRRRWYTVEEISSFLKGAGFEEEKVFHPFTNVSTTLLGWLQFYLMQKKGRVSIRFSIWLYLLLEILNCLSRQPDPSNIIWLGEKP